jgi:threonine dehydrogenase-like Zn-dependent dehydrogenase
MKAVVCVDGGTEVVRLPDPVPRRDEVVVAVAACGLCGSDVHAIERGQTDVGQILGHEFGGRVVEVGADADPALRGRSVAVNPLGSCGTCDACTRALPFRCGRPNIGITAAGGYAEYVAVPARQLVPLPDDFPVERAAGAEPLAVSMAAVHHARVRPGDVVLVYGLGSIGLNAIIALRLLGIDHIIGAGRTPGRRAAAERVGASEVIDTRETGVREHAAANRLRYAAVLECSGAATAVPDALDVLGPGGVCVVVSLSPHVVDLPLPRLLDDGLSVVGSCAFSGPVYRAAVRHIVAGRVPTHDLVSEQVGLAATPDALRRLRTPGELVRVLARPQD